MRQPWRSHSGQAVFSEYMMVIFLVVGALTAITVYVQRTLQARIHDTNNYMINAVNSVCDANCQTATGGSIASQYEPYYTQTTASVSQNSEKTSAAAKGSSQEGVYYQTGNNVIQQNSNSVQLPAECAGPNGPSCCTTSPPSC